MEENFLDSVKSDKNGNIQTSLDVDKSEIYSTIDEAKVAKIVKDYNLPPPPLPLSTFEVNIGDADCDPYKATTIIVENNETNEERKEKRKWNKPYMIIGILTALLVVVSIVAISVPISLYVHYTDQGAFDKSSESTTPNAQDSTWPTSFQPNFAKVSVASKSSESTTPNAQDSTWPSSFQPNFTIESIASNTTIITSTTPVSNESTKVPSTSTTKSTPIFVENTQETTFQKTVSSTPSVIGSGSERCTSTNKCFSCTCSSPACPADGQVSTVVDQPDCDGACVTYANGNDNNKIQRGCAVSEWKEEYEENGIGCFTFLKAGKSSRVCFCCGHNCNNHSMIEYIDPTNDPCR